MSGLRFAVAVVAAFLAMPALAGSAMHGAPAHGGFAPGRGAISGARGAFAPMAGPNPALAAFAIRQGVVPGTYVQPGSRGAVLPGDRRFFGSDFGPVGWVGPMTFGGPSVIVIPPAALPAARLPTAADLPVANVVRTAPDPAVFYVINDVSQGRSGRSGGARIISTGPAMSIGGASDGEPVSPSGPKIIELTAQ